jgi:hypothetical protein
MEKYKILTIFVIKFLNNFVEGIKNIEKIIMRNGKKNLSKKALF